MRIDHVTLAVKDLETLAERLRDMGWLPRPVPGLFPGTQRLMVPLAAGFLEGVSVDNPHAARKSPWGRALVRFLREGEGIFRVVAGISDMDQFLAVRRRVGARYWSPIVERVHGPAGEAVAVRLTQIDLMMPWIVEYGAPPPWLPEERAPLWVGLDIESRDPMVTALQYRLALGIAIDDAPGSMIQSAIGDARLRFFQGTATGYRRVFLQDGERTIEIATHAGILSLCAQLT